MKEHEVTDEGQDEKVYYDVDYDGPVPDYEELYKPGKYSQTHNLNHNENTNFLNQQIQDNRIGIIKPTGDPLADLFHCPYTFKGESIYPSDCNDQLLLKALVHYSNNRAEWLYQTLLTEDTLSPNIGAQIAFYTCEFELTGQHHFELLLTKCQTHSIEIQKKTVADQLIINFMYDLSNGFNDLTNFVSSEIARLINIVKFRRSNNLPLGRKLTDFIALAAIRCIDKEGSYKGGKGKKVNPFPKANSDEPKAYQPVIHWRILYLLAFYLDALNRKSPKFAYETPDHIKINEEDEEVIGGDRYYPDSPLLLRDFPTRIGKNNDAYECWKFARDKVVEIISSWELFNKWADTKGKNNGDNSVTSAIKWYQAQLQEQEAPTSE